MSYQIEFSRQADRQFRNLPSQIQQRLKSRIDSLAATPRPYGSENSAVPITITVFGWEITALFMPLRMIVLLFLW